jgi:hypothetical protein
MWNRIIELPDHAMELIEIISILLSCLNETELEEVAEELLGWPSKGYEVLDVYDYYIDC